MIAEIEIRTGMWRTRDGSVASVNHRKPDHSTWEGRPPWEFPWAGCRAVEGLLQGEAWRSNGMYSRHGESPLDLVEFLTDETADPRTWKPTVVLKEGLWEREDGVRVLVVPVRHRGDRWYAVNPGINTLVYEACGNHAYDEFPRITRYLGPNPLKESRDEP
jgi:hypothetical protein